MVSFLTALLGDWLAVVGLVPLSEWVSVDLDDGALDKGVGSDELVVGGVVDDTDQTSLSGAVLGAPGKVARVQSKGSVLDVATTDSNRSHSLLAETSVGGLTTELVDTLLTELSALSTCS